MNMRQLNVSVILIMVSITGFTQEKTITLKKGEAVDVLLLSTNQEAKEEMDEYFSTAVPIAAEWGYQPQYSSKISTPPTQGNYWPGVFILATWKDYDKRIDFTTDIVNQYPQFHERRRTIWPTFFLTYWKVEEEQEISIDPEKVYIATAYWSETTRQFNSFQENWDKEVNKHSGKVVLELKDGTSPFGYYYNPERFTITEWNSKADFEKFQEQNQKMDHDGVKHVNQFILK